MPEFYKPSLELPKFIYGISEDKLYIMSSVSVYLPAHESLLLKEIVYDEQNKLYNVYYDHSNNSHQEIPYYFEHEALIEIISDVSAAGVHYDPANKDQFLIDLRNIMENSYNVTVNVLEKPNQQGSGGQDHDTIQKDTLIEPL